LKKKCAAEYQIVLFRLGKPNHDLAARQLLTQMELFLPMLLKRPGHTLFSTNIARIAWKSATFLGRCALFWMLFAPGETG
jgi:hypothetical protein